MSQHQAQADGLPDRLILGLAGPAGSGKDTCAALLQPLGFRSIAFAEPLRDEVCLAFHCDERVFADRVLKHTALAQLAISQSRDPAFVIRMEALGHDLQAPRSPRWLMQHWGTEYRLHQRGNYWTDIARRRVNRSLGIGLSRIVITDVRFPHEAVMLADVGGHLLGVHRPDQRPELDAEAARHTSETQLAQLSPVDTIVNDGTVDHLRNELLRVLVKLATAIDHGAHA